MSKSFTKNSCCLHPQYHYDEPILLSRLYIIQNKKKIIFRIDLLNNTPQYSAYSNSASIPQVYDSV